MREEICKAIRDRKLLSIYYEGEYRRVEPHCYGTGSKGQELLRAYQVEGYSLSGEVIHWKLFDVRKISTISVLVESFPGARADYNPNDPAISNVYCEL